MYKDNLLSLFIVVNTYALIRLTSSYCITNIGANAAENFSPFLYSLLITCSSLSTVGLGDIYFYFGMATVSVTAPFDLLFDCPFCVI